MKFILAILLQQKKEKEKQLQQAKRQFDSTLRENADKICRSSQLQLESTIKLKQKELEQLQCSITTEFDSLQNKKSQFEQAVKDHFTKIQQLQGQVEEIKRSIHPDGLLQHTMERYNIEIQKINDKLNAEYKRKVRTIKKKNNQKKRSEIQVYRCILLSVIENHAIDTQIPRRII